MRKHAAWIGGVVLLVIVVVVAAHHGDAKRFAAIASQAEPRWLVACVLLQVGTYVASGAIWRAALARAHEPSSLATLARLAVAKVFTDQAIPTGGLGGSFLVVRGVVRRGADRGAAAAAFVVSVESFYLAFVPLLGASLAYAWHRHAFSDALGGLALGVLVIALAVPGTMLALVSARRIPLPKWARRIGFVKAAIDALEEAPRRLVTDPPLLALAGALQAITIVLDGETLHASLAAVGAHVDAPVAIASFVFAMAAETVGPLPGGLGAFEATSVALLHSFGVPVEEALAATLLTRGFTFWLPMLPGAWIDKQELSDDAPEATPRESSAPRARGAHSAR